MACREVLSSNVVLISGWALGVPLPPPSRDSGCLAVFLSFSKPATCCGHVPLPCVFAPKVGCKVQIQSELSRKEVLWFVSFLNCREVFKISTNKNGKPYPE